MRKDSISNYCQSWIDTATDLLVEARYGADCFLKCSAPLFSNHFSTYVGNSGQPS